MPVDQHDAAAVDHLDEHQHEHVPHDDRPLDDDDVVDVDEHQLLENQHVDHVSDDDHDAATDHHVDERHIELNGVDVEFLHQQHQPAPDDDLDPAPGLSTHTGFLEDASGGMAADESPAGRPGLHAD